MSRKVEILERESLPCGCTTGRALINGEKVFFVDPCSQSCKYYKYMIDESKKQGKPIERRTTL